jgi:hypothetical protein
MVVTATWCNTYLLNSFLEPFDRPNALFSRAPLTALQCRNRQSAPTTQTRHPKDYLVQRRSHGMVMVDGESTWLSLLNTHAKVVLPHDRIVIRKK